MNAPTELDAQDVLRIKLAALRQQHRDLDDAIAAMQAAPVADQLAVRRLKKQKLRLKDEIARIEDILTPDIIA
ncbi:MAG: YdcH family protein [Alkalilacustris sp.]